MSIFHPRYRFSRIWKIEPTWLRQQGIQVLLLDVDNTLTTHDSPDVPPQVHEWIAQMCAEGFALLILSNNKSERVQPFADQLGLGCIANAGKPLTGGVRRAVERLSVKREGIAVIGDQIFTDVLCANLAGALSILVAPIELETFAFFRFKRRLERGILKRCGEVIA